MYQLSEDERAFFQLVGQAVMSNPFGDERARIDEKIAGRYIKPADEKWVDLAIGEVRRCIGELENKNRADIRNYSPHDRRLLTFAFLFDTFHRFAPRFDELIAAQMAAGDNSQSVAFASEMISEIERRGFSHREALRYFELHFQLRRAFFFIHQNLIGSSASMGKLREKLWNNVFTCNIDWYDRFLWNRMEDFSTLILGPTGAGKGTAAAAIGRSAYIPFDEKKNCFVTSFAGSFISLNLSEFSESLIESELFGHKKGAFTGAVGDYKGLFARCNPYGAIFLDEIGEVSHAVQIKLLQVLQDRNFSPVGSHQRHRFSGRIIAATNRPIKEIRQKKILRDDFFYRLCSDVILIPSLAQRIDEDPAELRNLLAHTITRILGSPSLELLKLIKTGIERDLGLDYAWPGNVRELEQCVRQMMLNGEYHPVDGQIPFTLSEQFGASVAAGSLDAHGLLAGYCYCLYQRFKTYEAVARKTGLDRRTVKKYVLEGQANPISKDG